VRPLTDEEKRLIAKNRLLRRIVSLGLTIRSNRTIKVRTPLASARVAFPQGLLGKDMLNETDLQLLRQELNVKTIELADDPGTVGERFVQVDARKAGPRLGKRVQEIIQAGKKGEFTVLDDGSVEILGERLSADEAPVLYRGREGSDVAADAGVVVSLDINVSDALQMEGLARDLIRAIQKLRKEQGYSLGEKVAVGLGTGADAVLAVHQAMIEQETSAIIGKRAGKKHIVLINDEELDIYMDPKPAHG
jgi:isoleucyl-tRNA synthetase